MTTPREGPFCPEDGVRMEKRAEYGSLTYYSCPQCPGFTYDGDQGCYYSGIPDFATELHEQVDERDLVITNIAIRVDAYGEDAPSEAREVLAVINEDIAYLGGSPVIEFFEDLTARYEKREV